MSRLSYHVHAGPLLVVALGLVAGGLAGFLAVDGWAGKVLLLGLWAAALGVVYLVKRLRTRGIPIELTGTQVSDEEFSRALTAMGAPPTSEAYPYDLSDVAWQSATSVEPGTVYVQAADGCWYRFEQVGRAEWRWREWKAEQDA